jgi:hypothetical protein
LHSISFQSFENSGRMEQPFTELHCAIASPAAQRFQLCLIEPPSERWF